MLRLLKKWAREPLLHFLFIGVGAYALLGWLAGGESQDDERVVLVTANDLNALVGQWKKTWMRPPTEEEFAFLINAHVREKVLFKEAMAMGLDADDAAIEQRLAQKLELLARSLSTPAEPSDAVLREWYGQKTALFGQPDLYSVVHVFFDLEKRETTVLDDARAALKRLNELKEIPRDFASYGDRAVQQSFLDGYSDLEMRRLFGSQLVDEIVRLQPGIWHGPLVSEYGAHLVRVIEVLRSPPLPFEAVREEVAERWMAEQIDVMSERFIDDLMSRYDVVVESTETPSASSGTGATP